MVVIVLKRPHDVGGILRMMIVGLSIALSH